MTVNWLVSICLTGFEKISQSGSTAGKIDISLILLLKNLKLATSSKIAHNLKIVYLKVAVQIFWSNCLKKLPVIQNNDTSICT